MTDSPSPRAAFIKWFVLGAIVAVILVWAQTIEVDGITGLIQVGEHNDLRPFIEAELGEIPLAPDRGHDGQMFYAIGLDPSGSDVGQYLDHPGYRLRRILYPAVASLFGTLDGRALLYSMIALSVLSAATAAGATAWLAVRGGRSDWLALAVVLNPGVWLSVRILTSDVVALALMLLALVAWTALPRLAVVAFALSGLAKDVLLLTPFGLATRKRWQVAVIPALVLIAWAVWVGSRVDGGLSPGDNFTLPFLGIIDATSNWTTLRWQDWFYLGVALAAVFAGVVASVTLRRSWLWSPIVFWTALGIVSSSAVWDFGNNAMRAFAPLIVLVALSTADPSDVDEADRPLWTLPFSVVGQRTRT